MISEMMREIDPEQVAYWYMRLNGFLTTTNFVVHPEQGEEPRTDVDVIGVRFPFRAELLTDSMQDDVHFETKDRICIALTEVKKGRCKLNGPWTRRQDENMQRVLAAIGAIPQGDRERAALNLYDSGLYKTPSLEITLCCLGKRKNPELLRQYPKVPQILWTDVARFVYRRFTAYRNQKVAHRQWDDTGRYLYELVFKVQNAEAFAHELGAAVDRFRPRVPCMT